MTRALVLWTLLAAPAWAADPFVGPTDGVGQNLHLRLDTDVTWGIGSQMYVGGLVHLDALLPVWHTRPGTGTFDFGLRLAYGNEGLYLAPWIDPDEISGSGNRVQVQASVGTTFHLTPQRRLAFALRVLAGWTMLHQHYTVTYADEDFSEEGTDVHNAFVASGDFTAAWRASRNVGVNLSLSAPFPTTSSYVIGLGQLGVGMSFYLR